ncbi:zinc ribbon domain-containing protein [bacterium]|nr:zinc ribbon domain-containing protein [bacterium]
MAQCPECHKEQNADFGMVTCAHCGAVFMVELDGEVNASEQIDAEVVSDEAESLPEAAEEPFGDPPEESLPEAFTEEEPLAAEQEVVSAEDPLGVQSFEDSGGANLADGEYLYDIILTHVDSADLKREVMMALSDKRFALEAEDLQKQMREGGLTIQNLNPVKAMLIVLRLQQIDVVVEWRQKHFTLAEDKKNQGEAEL